MRSVLNTVDLIAILPHYLQILLECFEDQDVHPHSGDIETVARVGKVTARHSGSHSSLVWSQSKCNGSSVQFCLQGGPGSEDHASDENLQDPEAGSPLNGTESLWLYSKTVLPAGLLPYNFKIKYCCTLLPLFYFTYCLKVQSSNTLIPLNFNPSSRQEHPGLPPSQLTVSKLFCPIRKNLVVPNVFLNCSSQSRNIWHIPTCLQGVPPTVGTSTGPKKT